MIYWIGDSVQGGPLGKVLRKVQAKPLQLAHLDTQGLDLLAQIPNSLFNGISIGRVEIDSGSSTRQNLLAGKGKELVKKDLGFVKGESGTNAVKSGSCRDISLADLILAEGALNGQVRATIQ